MGTLTTLHSSNNLAIQSVRDLYSSSQDSDVTLLLSDELLEVKAHKFVLGFHSEIFRSVLETVPDLQSTISLPETSFHDLNLLLQLLYFRKVPSSQGGRKNFLDLLRRFKVNIPVQAFIEQDLDESETDDLESKYVDERVEEEDTLVIDEGSSDFSEISCKSDHLDSLETIKHEESLTQDNTKQMESLTQDNTKQMESLTQDNTKQMESLTQDNTKQMESLTQDNTKQMESLTQDNTKQMESLTQDNTKQMESLTQDNTKQMESLTQDNTKQMESLTQYRNLLTQAIVREDKDNKIQVITCDKCQMTFPSEGSLREHCKSDKHKETRVTCNVCGRGFRNEMMLNIHREEHQQEVQERNGRLVCNKCDKTFKDIYKLRYHKIVHVQGMFTCDQCPSRFSTYQGLKYHLEHHGEFLQCDQCDKIYKSKFQLKEHKLSVHQGLRLKCNHCERGFTNSSSLAKHVKTDHIGQRYNCEQCDYSAKKRNMLRIHIEAEHPREDSELYQCQGCSYTTYSPARFKNHSYSCKKKKERKVGLP